MMQTQTELSNDSEFSIRSSSPSVWRMITSIILALSEDATFDVDADGVRTRAMDSSHVALVDLKFPSTSFEKFLCSKPTRFTVHIEDFSKIVRRAELKESFEISRSSSRSISIKIGHVSNKREFELHLLDNDLKSSPVPRLTFTTRFTMNLETFSRILTDISIISTYINVQVSPDILVLSGKGDSGRVEVTVSKEEGTLLQEVQIDQGGQVTKAVYNLEFILKIVKSVSQFSDLVRFEYSTKMPLRMEFFSWGRQSSAPVQLYLAPRIMD
jgi:proliferating cell nuclear antigen